MGSKKKSSTKSSSTKKETAERKQQAPPAGEATPVSTLATNSLEPAKPTDLGTVSGGLSSDDQKAAVERVEGRTSDAANRKEGTNVEDVPPDLAEGNKPSDGGADVYPFPPGGDVDIATVPTKANKGELLAPIHVGSWVRLAKHELVPDRLVGHIATVTNSPTVLCNCDWSPRTHEHQSKDAGITVQTRDEVNATLIVPVEAFSEISQDGRHGVAAHG